MFICGGRKFQTLDFAKFYANEVFRVKGIILGIEEKK